MERETAPNHDVHTYFGSYCAGYCLRHSKEIEELDYCQNCWEGCTDKADTGAEATVIPYELNKEIEYKGYKPLQKIQKR